MYNTGSQIKFKTSMLRSILCNYSDAYILVKGTISIERVLAPAELENVDNEVVFKICAPFTNCIGEISNTQINRAKELM